MRTARTIDETEHELIARGEAFFHVSSSGHEASAALASLLTPDDYLHCHYRDKALLLARGVPITEFFASLLCTGASHSRGRQMSAHICAPDLNILSIVGPVGNNALQAVGVAQQISSLPSRPVVLCSLGDGTTQEGEVLEAIAEAVRSTLPVLFFIQDNRYAISTRTAGKTFFSLPSGDADVFYGLKIHRVDGTDVVACAKTFQTLVDGIRASRGPAICVMSVERLANHTNADDETAYRDPAEIRHAWRTADPIAKMRETLLRVGVSESDLKDLEESIGLEVRAAVDLALNDPQPVAQAEAKLALPIALTSRAAEYGGLAQAACINMGEALRETLAARMRCDARVTLYGEDIEDPKGDVFGLTRGLTAAFPGRVCNSPLSESTIIGTSIGRALAGGRPVAFIQFADFLPLALNQIITELSSMVWRTNGGWTAPVIIMVTCGGYRPGLGPFHADTFESIIAHLPGIDVVMPSTAGDAAGMLNAAFASERPTLVLYPKALLNDPARATSNDVDRQFVPVGTARVLRAGTELTLVAWGNTVPICEKVATALGVVGASVEVLDLRWLSPWDREVVCASARKTRRLLVVHEDNLSGGFGAEIVATVAETLEGTIMCRRVARENTFVPCNFGNQLEILPSYKRTLEAAAQMLKIDLSWQQPAPIQADSRVVAVIGSSPSDQSVEVVEIQVKVGEAVRAGQIIASLDADKAVIDLAAPADGIIEIIHLKSGDRALVDAPLLTLRVDRVRQRQPIAAHQGLPLLRRRDFIQGLSGPAHGGHVVVLAGLGAVRGRGRLDNIALMQRFPAVFSTDGAQDGILERTGIESRLVADPDQDAVSMAVEAAARALADASIEAKDLGLVICSTSTPIMISPSTACQVLERLAPGCDIAAYDIQAACSGYLYALANAWDYLQSRPDATVLVITTETMRRFVKIDDPNTSSIFADAATATVVTLAQNQPSRLAMLHRPVLGAQGENGTTLRVPLPTSGEFLHMDGKRIFAQAVRRMEAILAKACAQSNLQISDLDLVVPHQANGRIIEAIRSRLKLPKHRVWNEIRFQGNTSSSSIPLALDTVLRRTGNTRLVGLTTFGAGYTFAGAILELCDKPK